MPAIHIPTDVTQWWSAPRSADQVTDWIAQYHKSLYLHHRDAIVKAIEALQPATVLEVGCHCAPNLVRLGLALPQLEGVGIDLSPDAIQGGKAWMAQAGLSARMQLHVGKIPDALYPLPTGAFDVVLSCYSLAYLAPADVDAVLFELGRLAAKAIVLAEPMPYEGTIPSRPKTPFQLGYQEWVHDYAARAAWITSWQDTTITLQPVTPNLDALNAMLIAVKQSAVETERISCHG